MRRDSTVRGGVAVMTSTFNDTQLQLVCLVDHGKVGAYTRFNLDRA